MLDRTGHAAAPVRRSPLAHRDAISSGDGRADLAERPFIGKLILRGDASKIGPAMTEQTGIALPTTPCVAVSTPTTISLWLGPSEWMVLTEEGEEKPLLAAIKEALKDVHHQSVDVTDHYTLIRVGGTKAREMLMKVTTLDLHPRAFPAGAVKGSIFGRVQATIYQPITDCNDPERLDLIIRRSHADYLWCLLALAGREYGLPEQAPEGRVKLAMS